MNKRLLHSLTIGLALNSVFGAVEVINPQDQARIDLAIQRSMQTYEEEMSARREDEAKLLKAIEASRKEEALRLEAAGNAAQKEKSDLLRAIALSKITATEDAARVTLRTKKEALNAIDSDYSVPNLSDFTMASSTVSDIEHTSDGGAKVYRKLSLKDDGLCGFYALGITQAEYVKMLNDKLRSLERAEDQGDYWTMRCQIENAINEERTGRDPSNRDFVDFADSSIETVTATVAKWIQQEHGYLDVGLLPWVADKLPFTAYIWDETKKSGGPLRQALKLEKKGSSEVRHLLRSAKHFDLLLPKLLDCKE